VTLGPFLAPNRDDRFKHGRPKSATTFYSLPGVWVNPVDSGSHAPTVGTDYYSPIYIDTPIVIDTLVAQVTVLAAGNMRMGLYRADTNWQPIGGPLTDSGDISTNTTGIKTFTPGTPILLERGRYLTVFNHSVAATFKAARGYPPGVFAFNTATDIATIGTRWRVTRAYAAFPTPGTAWDTTTSDTNMDQMIFLRISTP
jgi:hypothetical protein